MAEFDVKNLISNDKKTISKEDKNVGGRPSLPKDKKKDNKVMSYFTKKEKEQLQKLAESKNLSLSNFVRICALEKITPSSSKSKK